MQTSDEYMFWEIKYAVESYFHIGFRVEMFARELTTIMPPRWGSFAMAVELCAVNSNDIPIK